MRLWMLLLLWLPSTARAADWAGQLTAVMAENIAAANDENLPRLMKTMSREMPNRALFVQQTRKEWAESDLYLRLDKVQVKQVQLPYAIAEVTQTIVSGNAPEPAPDQLSELFGLRTAEPTTTSTILFRRESGKWKVVAGIDAQLGAQDNACASGRCQFP